MSILAILAALWAAPVPAQEPRPFELPPAPAAGHVDFSADHFDYERSSSMAHLQGRVLLKDTTWLIRAEEVWLDLEGRRAQADGYVQVEDGASLLFGDSGEFDYAAATGRLAGAAAGFAPWRIRSRSATLDSRRRFHFRRAFFSSCNDDSHPHYHFRAGSVHVRPRKWLYAVHAVFYMGRVPVFYTPLLWKSLRRKHLIRTRVSPGYDRRNGMFLRTTTRYSPFDPLLGRLLLDYHGAQGLGVGNELEVHDPGRANGALYGYRIRERRSGTERWTVLGDHFQTLPSSSALQMRLQTQSDPDFNNHYARSNSLRVTPELVNGAAFVRTTAKTTTRLSYSRLDAADRVRRVFLKSKESAPRLELRTAPLAAFGSSFLNTFEAFADNTYDRPRGFLQKSVGAGWRATRMVPLVRRAVLTPTVGYDQTYEDRRDTFEGFASTRTRSDAFTGHYALGGVLRLGTPLGDIDLGQSYKRRLRPGTLAGDVGAADRGVEENLLSLAHALRPSRSVFVRLASGYDWRVFRDHAVGFRSRVQPFTADAVWTPRPDLSLAVRDDYQLDEGNRAFAFQADWGERGERFLGFGASHNLADPSRYYAGAEFAWGPASGTWRAGGALRQVLHTARGARLDDIQLFEKELWLAKDWHDFRARVQLRVRPDGIQEAQLRVELRLDRERPVRQGADAPWRLWKEIEQDR